MDLAQMTPFGDLSSTGYALANPGKEYLILQPDESAEAFDVELAAGTYVQEWFSVNRRETKEADKVTVESTRSVSFSMPFEEKGAVVLYLKQARG